MKNIEDMLCIECGKRGFKRITANVDNVPNLTALECTSCQAHVYEHTTMIILQAEQRKQ